MRPLLEKKLWKTKGKPRKYTNYEKHIPFSLPGNHTFPSGDLPGLRCFGRSKTPDFLEKSRESIGSRGKTFHLTFRETILFLPGTFRDCGVLAVQKHLTFLRKGGAN